MMGISKIKEEVNGLRIPLMIDSALLVTGLIFATLMYGDVQALKENQVPESRVVAVEVELRNLNSAVQGLQVQQNASTQQIIAAILRENNERKEKQ